MGKPNWGLIIKIILIVCCVVGVFVVWKYISGTMGAAVAGILSLFGFGGRGAVRKARKRGEKKAEEIRDRGPDAVTDDINERLRRLKGKLGR